MRGFQIWSQNWNWITFDPLLAENWQNTRFCHLFGMRSFIIVCYGNTFIPIQFICYNMTANAIHKWGISTFLQASLYSSTFSKTIIMLKGGHCPPLIPNMVVHWTTMFGIHCLPIHHWAGLVKSQFILCFIFCLLPSRSLEKILHLARSPAAHHLHSVSSLLSAMLKSKYT